MTAFIENLAVALYTRAPEGGMAHLPSAEGAVDAAIGLATCLCARLGHDATARLTPEFTKAVGLRVRCKRCGQTLDPDPEKR